MTALCILIPNMSLMFMSIVLCSTLLSSPWNDAFILGSFLVIMMLINTKVVQFLRHEEPVIFFCVQTLLNASINLLDPWSSNVSVILKFKSLDLLINCESVHDWHQHIATESRIFTIFCLLVLCRGLFLNPLSFLVAEASLLTLFPTV